MFQNISARSLFDDIHFTRIANPMTGIPDCKSGIAG
jgi:hypothetical protein